MATFELLCSQLEVESLGCKKKVEKICHWSALVSWVCQKMDVVISNSIYVVLYPMLSPLSNFTQIGGNTQQLQWFGFIKRKKDFKNLPKLIYPVIKCNCTFINLRYSAPDGGNHLKFSFDRGN